MRLSIFVSAAIAVMVSAQVALAGGTMIKVISVVNGSTLKADVRGKVMNIRLLGIATPDPNDAAHPVLKQLGTEARQFLEEFSKSRTAYAEFPGGDPVPDADGLVDALLWGGTNAEFVNEKIVKDGFGIVDGRQTQLKSALRAQLTAAERSAKFSARGLWGDFTFGSGHDVAAGRANQGTYFGVPGGGGRSRSSEVSVWIVFFR
jgi:endonuclease YncB( thermonuclease family)